MTHFRFETIERRLLLADFVVISTLDSGDGTLRAAIDSANLMTGPHTISFNIGSGPQTIAPLSFYPPLLEPVSIDGTTQPGFAGEPIITIDGINLPSSSGLRLAGGSSTVRGLVITRFGNNALALDSAGGNVVEGNHLISNGGDGLQVNFSGNRVGGTTAAQRNVISGNGDSGIDISGGSNNLVQGNFVGTDVTGTTALPNANYGVRIANGSNNTIGGTTAAERNVISGNASDGVRITGFSSANFVRGNWIGLNVAGAMLGNAENGITIFSGDNTIGGGVAGAGNVISANADHGIEISGAPASGNVVQGNLIGTDSAGNADFGNGLVGVRINESSNTLVGGTSAAGRNIISGNNSDGVRIEGVGATANTIQGNFIGTNALGSASIANSNDGIQIRNGANTVGGTQSGAGNLISGNTDDGIDIRNTAADGNVVQGNSVGTDLTATTALPNGSDAIEIHGALNTTVGGTTPAARNILSGNVSDGIEIIADLLGPATGSRIRGNSIGTNVNGNPLANAGHGIKISGGGSTSVGGVQAGAGNTIANNGLDGVFVEASSGNSIRGNSIFANGTLGIDLAPDGVTPNDLDDSDAGSNDLQNFPVISAAAATGGSTIVHLSLRSTPSSQFTIDIYSSTAADPSGFGEGGTFLASTLVVSDGAGNAAASVNVGNVPAGLLVTATATTAAGSTSEFSQAVPVSFDPISPAVNSSTFLFDGFTLPAAPHRLTYAFTQDVGASLGPEDLLLENLTTTSTVPTASIAVGYDAISNTGTFTFPGLANGILPDGRYRATLLASGVTNPAGDPMLSNHASQFFFMAGDANHDAIVNLQDFNILAANFGQSPRTFSQGDFNYDGQVNLSDFNILASRFGMSVAPQSMLSSPFADESKISGRDGIDELLA